MTIIIAFGTRRFYDANPRLAAAFVAALGEAAHYVAARKRDAARSSDELAAVKSSEDDLMRLPDDADTRYSAAPEGLMEYAEFLHRIGRPRNQPAGWKDLFFPPIDARAGS